MNYDYEYDNDKKQDTKLVLKCLLFYFLMIRFTVIPKKSHLASGNLAKLVFWSTLSLMKSKYVLSLTQFSLVTVFFDGTRENILHIFQAYHSSVGLLMHLVVGNFFCVLNTLLHNVGSFFTPTLAIFWPILLSIANIFYEWSLFWKNIPRFSSWPGWFSSHIWDECLPESK